MADLLKESTSSLFRKYLLPSISSTFVTSVYVLADSIIIGKGIGSRGIAALNLILPVFSLFFGTGLLLGVGGGVLLSVAHGSGQRKKANEYFSISVSAGMVISILLTIVCFLFFRQILSFLGATEETYPYVKDYIVWVFLFCPVFVFSSLLQAFVRNDKAPKCAMLAVISGGVTNIILDLVFIYGFSMGMAGGAIATVIGSFTTVCILSTHFLSKNNTLQLTKIISFSKPLKEVLQCGAASFFIDVANGVVMLCFNLQLLHYIGEQGVVIYSIISNCSIIAMSLFNGVAQAAQPLMAINYGAKLFHRVLEVRKIALTTIGFIGVMIFLTGFFFPEMLVHIFIHAQESLIAFGRFALPIHFIAFLFMSVNILLINYFQSVVEPQFALVICLLRGLILSIGFVFLLPAFLPTWSIWFTIPLTEALTFLVGICLKNVSDRKKIAAL